MANPLSDDEVVYRRLPANPQFYDASHGIVKEAAFRPTPADTDGLSLSREVVGPAGAAATGQSGKAFFVAALRVGSIRAAGLDVVADRDDHALLPDLTNARRQSADRAVRDQLLRASADLVAIVSEVTGPYPGRAVPPPTSPPSPA